MYAYIKWAMYKILFEILLSHKPSTIRQQAQFLLVLTTFRTKDFEKLEVLYFFLGGRQAMFSNLATDSSPINSNLLRAVGITFFA